MPWHQQEILLKPRTRGFHLVTHEIESALHNVLADYRVGLVHLFIQHTSASLTINENADPSVRVDFENHFNRMVPENAPYYTHTLEGADDMPAHMKSSLLGASVTLPVTSGRFNMGIWQGIYLCEHRNHGGRRTVLATIQGE
ncbi:MAG: hypothetical protein CSA49_06820 [Gammaproteobacteria bacterium]|nr:MAG: hypothetical protein CSA49_06820 [Gammaproteobacteria bacterium]